MRGDEGRSDRLRGWRSREGNELVGRLRDRPRGHDPRDGDRAGHGDLPGRVRDSGDRGGHAHGLPALPAARGALRDDARAHRRVALVRLSGVQGEVAELRQARQRLHGMGVLARLVPRGAAQHDPGVVLHHREVQPLAEGLHADPHADRVLDDRHLDRRASCSSSSRPGSASASAPPSRPCSASSR